MNLSPSTVTVKVLHLSTTVRMKSFPQKAAIDMSYDKPETSPNSTIQKEFHNWKRIIVDNLKFNLNRTTTHNTPKVLTGGSPHEEAKYEEHDNDGAHDQEARHLQGGCACGAAVVGAA